MEAKVYTEIRALFTEYLTEKKLRKTEERYTIFKEICAFPGHFDVCMLSDRLEQDNFHVSKATLYNTLDVLVDAGLVVRHQITVQSVQYELRIYADTHLHLVCTSSSSYSDFFWYWLCKSPFSNTTFRSSTSSGKVILISINFSYL